MNNAIVAFALARLKEPSTWASVAIAIVGLNIPEVTAALHGVAPYLVAVGTALGAGLPEGK